MAKILSYQGNALTEKQGDIEAYLPSEELINAVNVALYLNRPLLLMGEPGCGKTRLAEALAYDLHRDKWEDHFFSWYVKSTTKAQEGLCQIDNLQRLYDVNMKVENFDPKSKKYHLYGILANAFMKTPNGVVPNILLIDEIDKADIDFPNDLLLELDKKEFVIPETGEIIKTKSKPIVIITSNRERELPDAFLRRCVYHYIDFPDEKTLKEIVMAHFKDNVKDDLLDKALTAFLKLREEGTAENKRVSTSELLDWYNMLQYCQSLKDSGKELSKPESQLVAQLDLLGIDKIPFKQVLLKNYNTYTQNDEN